MTLQQPKKGSLLVAKPSIIGDMSFNRAVILLADCNKNGSVGFIMNKVLDFSLSDFLPELNKDFKIFNGGPVEQDNLYFIHQVPDLIPQSIEISNGIFWGGNFEAVKKLIEQDLITSEEIKFFLGYSGWEPKQLEEEVKADTWIITDNSDQKNILSREFTTFWKEKLEEQGGEFLIWSNAPENPSYN